MDRSHVMTIRSISILTILLLASALGSGCGKKEDHKAATQVAAKVNSDEITVHQVNNILARNPDIAPEVAVQAKREILDRLIDQQLASQKAIENKLDRSPGVVQAIESAKTEILARAYLEHTAAGIPKTAPWEVQKYYKDHPELFSQRRLFNFEELAFAATNEVAAALREQLAKGRPFQEVADWLQSRGIKFAVSRVTRAAEQIPLEVLPKVQEMNAGQSQLFELGNDRFMLIRIVSYKEAPVDEATASPRIQQFLWNRRSAEVIAREMKRIRDQAKIEYVGEFAGGGAAAEATNKAGEDSEMKTTIESKGKSEPRTQTEAARIAK